MLDLCESETKNNHNQPALLGTQKNKFINMTEPQYFPNSFDSNQNSLSFPSNMIVNPPYFGNDTSNLDLNELIKITQQDNLNHKNLFEPQEGNMPYTPNMLSPPTYNYLQQQNNHIAQQPNIYCGAVLPKVMQSSISKNQPVMNKSAPHIFDIHPVHAKSAHTSHISNQINHLSTYPSINTGILSCNNKTNHICDFTNNGVKFDVNLSNEVSALTSNLQNTNNNYEMEKITYLDQTNIDNK